MQFFARLCNLVRGALSGWIGRREHRHPEAVYEAAIQERIGRYAKLREAAAGILYLRSKLGKELERQSDELVRVRRQLDIAVERDDDPAALALIARREALAAEVNRLTAELTELTREAETAKQNLLAFDASHRPPPWRVHHTPDLGCRSLRLSVLILRLLAPSVIMLPVAC